MLFGQTGYTKAIQKGQKINLKKMDTYTVLYICTETFFYVHPAGKNIMIYLTTTSPCLH